MRGASGGLIGRFAAGSTTLSRVWRIAPKGGAAVKRFTDHDEDISLAEGLYKSSASCTPQAVVSTIGQTVNNTEMAIVFTGDSATGLDRTALLQGAYDAADFIISVADWLYPQYGTMPILAGTFGAMIADNNGSGSISCSGLISKLDKILGERYSAECRVDFGSTRCGIDLNAGIIGDKAKATLTATGNAIAAETVTIAGRTYTWRASVTTTADEVKVGASAMDSVYNLVQAVNGGSGSGTLYGSLTTAHATVDASRVDRKANFKAKTAGTAGNAFASTETMANASFGGATFSGGTATTALKTAATITTVVSPSKVIITPVSAIGLGILNMGSIVWDPATSNAGQAMEILVDTIPAGITHQLVLALAMGVTPLVGDTVVVYAGCDKLKTTCDVRFKNFINMQAEWGIPGSDAQQTI